MTSVAACLLGCILCRKCKNRYDVEQCEDEYPSVVPPDQQSLLHDNEQEVTVNSSVKRPSRRLVSKAEDVVADDHFWDDDKQLLDSRSRLADDAVPSTELQRDCSKPDHETNYDSRQSSTALDNQTVGRQPSYLSSSMGQHMDASSFAGGQTTLVPADMADASTEEKPIHDVLEIEDFLWRFIEIYHRDKLQSVCSSGITCTYSKDTFPHKLEIEGGSIEAVRTATEEIVSLCQEVADHIVEETFQLPQDTCEDLLQTAVKDFAESERMLFHIGQNSICHVVGPKDKVPVLKQRILNLLCARIEKTKEAARNLEWIASEASEPRPSSENAPDRYSMVTPRGITVEVYCSDLIDEKVDAIVNPANSRLRHGSGAARAIANAAGLQLNSECREFISLHRCLKVTEVMHTSAGNLRPNIRYVIHAVGPRASDFRDSTKLFEALRKTFLNCLQYANDHLHIASVSIPAVSSGNFGVDKAVVAQSAYEGLMTFDKRMGIQYLQRVHFVNCDTPTTSVFVSEFKSLNDSPRAEVEDNGERKMDMDEKPDDRGSQQVPGTQMWQQTSEVEADQLQNVDQDDNHRLAVDQNIRCVTDQTQLESFPTSCSSLAATSTGSQTLVPNSSGSYQMVTPSGIDIQIYRGNLLDEKVEAIVSPANSLLIHGGGAARAIAQAAGRELQEECQAFISEHKELTVTQVMHTTSGKLYPPVIYVIHVAGPSASEFPNPDDLYQAVFNTFDHCLRHACDILHVSSVAIPAISSGIFGVPKLMVAEAAYDALMKFDHQIEPGTTRKLCNIHYVNLDAESTEAFVEVFSKPRTRQRCDGLGAGGDRSPFRAVVNSDPMMVSQQAKLVHSCLVAGKSSGNKRQRRLKKTDAATTEPNSNSPMDPSPRQLSAVSSNAGDGEMLAPDTTADDEDCVICLCPMTRPKKLACGHSFCADCIDESFKKCQPKCPSCGRLFGVMNGNQPPGTMTVQTIPDSLPGFEHCSTIQISYDIPSGTQNDSHPNPGEQYHGIHRTAYLPNNTEGNEICRLLRRAFDSGLIFTVGRSITTGRDNAVIWNDIHHKTSTTGQFGYPDPTYLSRVRDELEAKGIVFDMH